MDKTTGGRLVNFHKENAVPVRNGDTLLHAAIESGIPIFHVCGGNARCSTCRVLVIDGADQLSVPNEQELLLREKLNFPAGVRLACQTTVQGDGVTVRRIIRDEHDIRLYLHTATGQSGEEKQMVLFFLDIRKFTVVVHDHLPFDIIHIIRKLFNLFHTIIVQFGGSIIETTGDGFYAVFGCHSTITEAANNAVRAALSILKELIGLNQRYFMPFFEENIEAGIGIHAGPVVTGAIRIANQDHMVVMGLPVNIASRLQNATKDLNNSLLVSDEIKRMLTDQSIIPEPVTIRVQGIKESLDVYKLGSPFKN